MTDNETGAAPSNIIDGTALASKTAFLSLSFGCLGAERTSAGTEDDINTTADKTLLTVKKQLFESAEYAIIKREDGKFRRSVDMLCLRGIAEGIRTVPKGQIGKVYKMCVEYSIVRQGLVKAFVAVYPAIYSDALARLGPLADPSEYPAPESVEAHFYFRFRYVTFDVPSILKDVDVEMAAEQAEARTKILADATESIMHTRRVLMLAAVNGLKEALSPSADGEGKRFHKSAITKLQKFVDEQEFAIMNVTDDKELAALAEQARKLIAGVTAKDVRKDENFKEMLLSQVSDLSAALAPLVEDAGRVVKAVV
jgi:hypothetical protein